QDEHSSPGGNLSATRKHRARRKLAAPRATHSEHAAHNPYSRGVIRNMLLPPFNCSSVEQGIAIDARISTTMARDFHGDLETAVFSVRSGSASFISAPACQPLVGQSAPTIVSPRDRRDRPVSALRSLHLESGEYIAGRLTV